MGRYKVVTREKLVHVAASMQMQKLVVDTQGKTVVERVVNTNVRAGG